jgi:hypothetical protein
LPSASHAASQDSVGQLQTFHANGLAPKPSCILAYGKKIQYAPQIIAADQNFFKADGLLIRPQVRP